MVKCVLLLLCYHLLLGVAVSEFTPTVYPAKILPSSQCGQYSPSHEQLREVLQQIEQRFQKTIPASLYLTTTHQLPQATTTSLALLYWSTVTWSWKWCGRAWICVGWLVSIDGVFFDVHPCIQKGDLFWWEFKSEFDCMVVSIKFLNKGVKSWFTVSPNHKNIINKMPPGEGFQLLCV